MNRIILGLLMVCLSFAAMGQGKIYLGGTAGINGIFILNQNNYGQSELDYDTKTGSVYGLQLGYYLNSKNAINVEILFSNQGQAYKDEISNETLNKDVDLSYLMIPLTFKHIFGLDPASKRTRFYINIGPYLSLLQSAGVSFQRNGADTDLIDFVTFNGGNPNASTLAAMGNPSDDKDLFSGTDFGLLGGLGMDYNLAMGLVIGLELRAGMGLSDMNAESWQLVNRDNVYEKSRNFFTGIKLGVGYLF